MKIRRIWTDKAYASHNSHSEEWGAHTNLNSQIYRQHCFLVTFPLTQIPKEKEKPPMSNPTVKQRTLSKDNARKQAEKHDKVNWNWRFQW